MITDPWFAVATVAEQLRQDQEETRARETALREGVPVDRARRTPEQQGRWLLAGLLVALLVALPRATPLTS